MLFDLRFAIRTIRRSPAFVAAVVVLFTIGIGASTAVFSVVHGVLLRSLPYPDAGQLVHVRMTTPAGLRGPMSPPDYLDLSEGTRSATLAAHQGWQFHLRSESGKVPVQGVRATASFFDVLGVKPLLGRQFTVEEDRPGGNAVALVSHRFWIERLGANTRAVGETLNFDGDPLTIVGVMPADFHFPSRGVDVWVPLRIGDSSHRMKRTENYLSVIGRVKSSVERTQTEANGLARELTRRYPESNGGVGVAVQSMRDTMTRDVRVPVLLLFSAVTLVLLIACANGGHLMLARAASNAREFAVRRALGATTWRVVRHQLALSLVLSVMAALLGILVAAWMIDALRPVLPDALPRRHEIAVTPAVLLFAIASALVTSALAAAAPALRVSELGHGARVTRRWSGIPLAVQMAFSFVLLSGAGLLLHSLQQVLTVDLGFEASRVITVSVGVPPGTTSAASHFDELLQRIETIPGVTSVGAVNYPPLASEWASTRFIIERNPPASPDKVPVAAYRVATPGYIHAAGATLKAGRFFHSGEGRPETPVFVINEAMARRYWPGDDPVGSRLRTGGLESQRPWGTVIGVVADMRQTALDVSVEPEIFQPHQQFPWPEMHLIIRTGTDTAAIWPSVRASIVSMNRDHTIGAVRTFGDLIDGSVRVRRFYTFLLVGFAAIGALLVAVGIHAALAFSVALRTREIGVRFALGASRGAIIRMLAAAIAVPLAIGLALGAATAWSGTRLIATLVYGGFSFMPLVTAAGAMVLLAALASAYPTLRATRIAPSDALRVE